MLLDLLFGQDYSYYNMNVVLFYIFIAFILFVICVIISNKLNIYSNSKHTRNSRDDGLKESEKELSKAVINEIAATCEDTKGISHE